MVRLGAWAFLPGMGARYVTRGRAIYQWAGIVTLIIIALAIRYGIKIGGAKGDSS